VEVEVDGRTRMGMPASPRRLWTSSAPSIVATQRPLTPRAEASGSLGDHLRLRPRRWLVAVLVSSTPSPVLVPVPIPIPFAHQVGAPGQDKGPQSRPVSESSGGTILLACLVSAANVHSSRSDRPSSDTLIILPLHRQSTPQNGIHSPRLAVGDSRLATLHVICRVATGARANDTPKGPAWSVCRSLALGQT
jgi:hypothetical protein